MAQLLLANPRKRRTVRRKSARRSLSTLRRRTRRNPSPRGIAKTFTKSAIGAGGALAVDVLMSKLPIPANLQTGLLAPITRGLVGIGLGMLVAKVAKKRELGEQLADGAVTVALYGAGKTMIGPSIGLSGDLLGNAYYDVGMENEFGYLSPAATYSPAYMNAEEEIYSDNSY